MQHDHVEMSMWPKTEPEVNSHDVISRMSGWNVNLLNSIWPPSAVLDYFVGGSRWTTHEGPFMVAIPCKNLKVITMYAPRSRHFWRYKRYEMQTYYNERLSYFEWPWVTSSDLAKYSMTHRPVFLQQLSFLSNFIGTRKDWKILHSAQPDEVIRNTPSFIEIGQRILAKSCLTL